MNTIYHPSPRGLAFCFSAPDLIQYPIAPMTPAASTSASSRAPPSRSASTTSTVFVTVDVTASPTFVTTTFTSGGAGPVPTTATGAVIQSNIPVAAIASGTAAGVVLALAAVIGWTWWGRCIKRKEAKRRKEAVRRILLVWLSQSYLNYSSWHTWRSGRTRVGTLRLSRKPRLDTSPLSRCVDRMGEKSPSCPMDLLRASRRCVMRTWKKESQVSIAPFGR